QVIRGITPAVLVPWRTQEGDRRTRESAYVGLTQLPCLAAWDAARTQRRPHRQASRREATARAVTISIELLPEDLSRYPRGAALLARDRSVLLDNCVQLVDKPTLSKEVTYMKRVRILLGLLVPLALGVVFTVLTDRGAIGSGLPRDINNPGPQGRIDPAVLVA